MQLKLTSVLMLHQPDRIPF